MSHELAVCFCPARGCPLLVHPPQARPAVRGDRVGTRRGVLFPGPGSSRGASSACTPRAAGRRSREVSQAAQETG